jgi:hypothetical protein
MPLWRRTMLSLLLAAGFATSAVAQQAPSLRLRGTITAHTGEMLTVLTRAGETVTVVLRPDTGVIVVVPSSLDTIKKGSFIGTAAMPGPNGTLVALEVHVFPDQLRGMGEGHRPFDLQPESTMTNGTVGDVTGATGRTLTVSYKGGEKTVTVPPDVPIVALEPTDGGMLSTGSHVILFGSKQADGSLVATRILVGKNGLVPPM